MRAFIRLKPLAVSTWSKSYLLLGKNYYRDDVAVQIEMFLALNAKVIALSLVVREIGTEQQLLTCCVLSPL